MSYLSQFNEIPRENPGCYVFYFLSVSFFGFVGRGILVRFRRSNAPKPGDFIDESKYCQRMRKLFKMHPSIYITLFIFIVYVESIQDNMERKLPLSNITGSRLITDGTYGRHGVSQDVNNVSTRLKACKLDVTDLSVTQFSRLVLKYRYNFVHLKLNFVNFSVYGTERVITRNDWIWTFKGENGAHQYLYLPTDLGYLSFGLLWSHTLREKVPINIRKTGDCSNLTIGLNETDSLIGYALGNMTAIIASRHDMYNSSYWCYNKRSWRYSSFLYDACKHTICTFQTIEYSCCKFFIDYTEKTRTVKCSIEHYQFDALWWILPRIIGDTLFAFYPILLMKTGMAVKAISARIKKDRNKSFSMDLYTESTQPNENNEDKKNKHLFISLKDSNPVTFLSTLCTPIYGWDLSSPVMSRALRVFVVILPIALSTTRVLIEYIYAKDFVIDAVKKGALVAFSTIIAGPDEARKHFLCMFGGPVVAVTIYVSFGCLLIVFPSNLEDFIESGLPSRVKKFIFLARMPLKLKERLSGIRVKHRYGYEKLHKLFLAQIFMLLHRRFWGYSIKMFYCRWKNIIFATMAHKFRSMFAAFLLSFLCLPLYIMFCLIELVLSVIYYVFPVVNCFFIVMKSFLIHYAAFFQDRGCIMKCLQFILFLPMLISFCISWYMYCIIFFDGFWFLSRLAMFTYTGIIAYPKLSYGYLVLVAMGIYYILESFNAFGESYRELLKISLEACEKIQQKHIDASDADQEEIKAIRTKHGIKCDLYYIIVDTHLPRRNQVLITILKFTSVITVLTISVELLIAFDKFQDLSLISHVFTVLFICALPKIIKTMCLQNHRHKTRREMRSKILHTVADYVRNRSFRSSDDEVESVLHLRSSGYETVHDTDSEQ